MENEEKASDTIETLKIENEELKKAVQQLKSGKNSGSAGTDDKCEDDNSENRFRTIFEASKIGNKVITSDLEITQVNPAMVALLGYGTKEDLIGTKITDYSPPDHKQHWKDLQNRLWEELTPSFSLETSLIKKDGSIVWCSVISLLFEDRGETFGYTTIEDISERRNLKLQKEEFITVASHEIKTPITGLTAGLQLLSRMITKETSIPDEIHKLVMNAVRNTAKLTHLVDDLLNVAKFEQGEIILNKTTVTLSDLIDNCCSHIRLDGKFDIKFKGDRELKVNADYYKLDQVLINLVNNAVKYAPESKEIVVEVQRLDDKIKISVTDRGKGIPPEKIPHLFDRYYQVKKDSNHSSGLGLGLYISAEIIRKHGGEIGVDSELGKGSSFWFTLPID